MTKRAFFLSAITAILSSTMSLFAYEGEVAALSENLASEIASAGKSTLAVVDFTDLQGNTTELGRFLAEEFSVALTASASGSFEVIDRIHLRVILDENKLALTGLIDPDTARKLGKIAGVEALISGTVTPLGDTIRLTVKVLDAETARIISSTAGAIPRTQAIDDLLKSDVISSSGAGNSRQGGTVSFSKRRFEDGGLVIDFSSLTRSNDARQIQMTFLLQNKSTETAHLCIRRKDTLIVNEIGDTVYARKAHGLGFSDCGRDYQFTALPKQSSLRGSIHFSLYPLMGTIDGTVFGLNVGLYRYDKGNATKIPISVPEIEISDR